MSYYQALLTCECPSTPDYADGSLHKPTKPTHEPLTNSTLFVFLSAVVELVHLSHETLPTLVPSIGKGEDLVREINFRGSVYALTSGIVTSLLADTNARRTPSLDTRGLMLVQRYHCNQ